jgi:hypothetical protein
VEDELAIFSGRTRFVSTKRLPDTKQVSDGMASGSIDRTNLSAHPVAHSYRLEAATTYGDGWAHADRDDIRYQSRPPPEYTNESVQPQIMMTQWRPPRRSHHPYASGHHHSHSHPPPSVAQHPSSVPHQHPPPLPPPPPHEHTAVTSAPAYTWPPHTPTHFRSSSSNFSSGSSHSHSLALALTLPELPPL